MPLLGLGFRVWGLGLGDPGMSLAILPTLPGSPLLSLDLPKYTLKKSNGGEPMGGSRGGLAEESMRPRCFWKSLMQTPS